MPPPHHGSTPHVSSPTPSRGPPLRLNAPEPSLHSWPEADSILFATASRHAFEVVAPAKSARATPMPQRLRCQTSYSVSRRYTASGLPPAFAPKRGRPRGWTRPCRHTSAPSEVYTWRLRVPPPPHHDMWSTMSSSCLKAQGRPRGWTTPVPSLPAPLRRLRVPATTDVRSQSLPAFEPVSAPEVRRRRQPLRSSLTCCTASQNTVSTSSALSPNPRECSQGLYECR